MSTRRIVAALCLLLTGLVGLPACSTSGGSIHAQATFDDVADLASGAPVMMADVTIGHVSAIHLDPTGRRATVRLVVRRSARVPADVLAQVRRTTPLGEKFVGLVPRTDDPHAALLADGATIGRTVVVSDVEQLVSSGTATFGALSASELSILLDEGARSFAGKGPELNAVLSRLADVAKGYRSRTGQITSIIDNLNHLSGDLAPNTGANGQALANMKDTLGILNQNDARFFALVASLNRVADDGNRILSQHLTQILNEVHGLRDVTGAVAQEQTSLGQLLVNLYRHNVTVPQAERNNFVNVLLDIVLCGIPGGGDVPGSAVDACYPGSGGGHS